MGLGDLLKVVQVFFMAAGNGESKRRLRGMNEQERC